MLEFGLIIVSIGLVLVSILLHEATTELKRLRSEDRLQATVGALLDAKHSRHLSPLDRQKQAVNLDTR